jgi:allophanate hydrolase
MPFAPSPKDALLISTLAAHYASGDWTASEVLDSVLDRIAAYPDKSVWIDLLPPAAVRAQVRRVEDQRAGGSVLPLYGVPFAVKDNIDVEGRQTTAACPAFAYTATESATIVRKLCNAGAILVGKTNLDQFATGLVGTRSPYGACRNPFDGRYISGGSSSGSAVAVAAGLVSFALGTDTAGSGRVPAAFNNIVGWKPTRGRLSTAGFVPACRSLDCPSVFALVSEDLAAVARVVSGPDAADPYSRSPEETAGVPSEFPGKFRFGVPADDQLEFFGNGAGPVLFRRAVQRLEELGGVASPIDFAPFMTAAKLLYDGPWIAERLAAIRSFYAAHADDMLPVTRSIIGSATKISAVDAFEGQYELRRIARLAQEQWRRMDVLLVPTAGRIYTIDDVQREPLQLNRNLGYYTNFVNLLDLGAVAVPNGFEPGGLPAGVTLIAPAGSDEALLKLAGRFHRATGLTLGALGSPMPAPPTESAPPAPTTPPGVQLAVVGAHLSGMPLNHQLTDSGGKLVRACRTAAKYRLYALPGTTPPKPGLVRAAAGGGAIDIEVWELSAEAFGKFVAAIPPPLGIGTIELEDGSLVKSFLCESYVTDTAPEITTLGGWRQYMASPASGGNSKSETPASAGSTKSETRNPK